MKKYASILLIAALAVFNFACKSDKDDDNNQIELQLKSVTPNVALKGESVTIKGIGFGLIKDSVSVKFGSINANFELIADTTIITSVPINVSIGNTELYVKVNGQTKFIMITVKDELEGVWVSEGAGQVAPGLAAAPFKTKKITATFNSNQTYLVVSVDSSNTAVTYEGTWVAGDQAVGSIRTIELNQTVPTSVTSTGIFQVEGTNLTYEVIQTTPAIDGIAAPTVEGGFGSTSYLTYPLGATWIQKFVVSTK